MEQIRFKGRDGKVKYIADSKGNIKQIDKNGKPKDIVVKEGKSEEVQITPEDFKE